MSKNKVHTSSKANTKGVNNNPILGMRFTTWAPLLLMVCCFLLYANTLGHDFAFDDTVVITGNQFTQKGIKGIPELLTKDMFAGIYGKALELSGGRYRPLSLVMFAVEYELWGANPFPGHLINVLLYGLTLVVLFNTLRTIFPGKNWLALGTCLLFAFHPIHTEVVANIKSRDEILCFLFLSLTLSCAFKYADTLKIKHVISGCVYYFLAFLSKENGITFVFLIPLALFCFRKLSLLQITKIAVPYWLVAIGFVLLRTALVGIIGDRSNPDIMENPFVNSDLAERTATVMHIIGKYLWMLFLPHPLSSDYSYNQIPFNKWTDVETLFPFLLFLGLGIWAIRVFVKKEENFFKKGLAYSFLFFISTIFLVSNMVFNIGAPMGERFLFLPSLAFCLSLSITLINVFKSDDNQSITFISKIGVFILMLCIVYGYKTISRTPDWYNNTTLFAADVKVVPNSAKARYYYGNTMLSAAMKNKELSSGKRDTLKIALEHTYKACVINPKFHHAFYNMGLIYQELNMPDSAIAYYLRVLQLQPTHILTQGALGTTYGKLKGDLDNAIKYLSIAVKYNPNDAGSYENLGIAFAKKGNTPEAIKAMERAIELNPQNAQTYFNLGSAYGSAGNTDGAIRAFSKALEFNSNNEQALVYLGTAFTTKEQLDDAIRVLERALQLNPQNFQTCLTLSGIYQKKGQTAKAVEYVERAKKINPAIK